MKDLEALLLYSTVASFPEFSEIPYLDHSVSCFENQFQMPLQNKETVCQRYFFYQRHVSM